MQHRIVNGIIVEFGDVHAVAQARIAMFDRLAVRLPTPEDKKREPVEAPAMLELPISESRRV